MTENKNTSKPVILVTGGSGYIGSHTVVALIAAGYEPVIVDNLSNSKVSVLDRIADITWVRPAFYNIDLQDRAALDDVFQIHPFAAVIHFAGFKAMGESIAEPLRYYANNIESTISLCSVMADHGVKRLIFSSSAAVYGESSDVSIQEDSRPAPNNPYARSKYMIEQILRDINAADSIWRIVLLRYFNPVGAHESGLIGEDPQGMPGNLMHRLSQVAVGCRERINIFGNDYMTSDDTGVRDYIHVMDLAEGHVAAVKNIEIAALMPTSQTPPIINLGTGQDYSVMEMIRTFENVSGKAIPYQITSHSPGDIAAGYANPSLAGQLLGWKARRSLAQMCTDAWRWQSRNPHGYPEKVEP
jgi:UDP-glucose 4-epimerase